MIADFYDQGLDIETILRIKPTDIEFAGVDVNGKRHWKIND